MRKLALLTLAPIAVAVATPAMAATTIQYGFSSTSRTVPSYMRGSTGTLAYVRTFDAGNASGQQSGNDKDYVALSNETKSGTLKLRNNALAPKPAGSANSYLYFEPGSSYSINSFGTKNLSVISFLINGVSNTASVVLTFANKLPGTDSKTLTLTGAQIFNGPTGTTLPVSSNGRVTYDFGTAGKLAGIQFTAGSTALGLDTIAGAAPEPAAWVMMILGFGLVGGALRRRRYAVSFAQA